MPICGTRKRSRKKQPEVCNSLTELERKKLEFRQSRWQDSRSPNLREEKWELPKSELEI